MFVKIDNYKNAFDIDTLINKTRNAENISPEFAMDVLRMGNYYGNIKKMLHCIKNLDESKWGEYKEFALSCVDGREVSADSWVMLCDLAKAGGYEEELNKHNANEKIYGAKSCKVCYREGKYIQEDLSNYDILYHKHNDDVVVWDAKLPKIADFSECMKEVDFTMTDCEKVEKFVFGENVERVRFIHVKNHYMGKKGGFPRILDLTDANYVAFEQCSFEDVEEFRFKKGSIVAFTFTQNHPKKIDFSMCGDLVGDFYADGVEELVFDNEVQADVFLGHIHHFSGKATILSQPKEQQRVVENKSIWKRIFSKGLES